MNKLYALTILSLLNAYVLFGQSVYDTVDMNGGYTNDIFYSLENGEVKSVTNSNWTVTFSTGAQTSAVMINGGKGVRLWETDIDNTNFATVDTANISSWQEVYDNDEVWDHSAFEFNRTGHPDYGWGTYENMSHVIYGDVVFVLETLNGTYYKVLLEKKELGEITYRYASIDNAFDTTLVYQASDLFDKDFVYLNMDDHTFNDREPVNTSWDMLFTRYYPQEFWGTGQLATGVLTSPSVEVAELRNIPNANATLAQTAFTSNKSEIGYDWKNFDFNIFEFDVFDSLTYFVKTANNDVYKVNFTRFDGQATGIVGFEKELIGNVTSINSNDQLVVQNIYPNPASDQAYVVFDAEDASQASFKVIGIDGAVISDANIAINQGLNSFKLDLTNFQNGMYFIQIKGDGIASTATLMVTK